MKSQHAFSWSFSQVALSITSATLLSVSLFFAAFVAQDASAAVTIYSSDEVTGTGLASRTAVDALNDTWETAVNSVECLCGPTFSWLGSLRYIAAGF